MGTIWADCGPDKKSNLKAVMLWDTSVSARAYREDEIMEVFSNHCLIPAVGDTSYKGKWPDKYYGRAVFTKSTITRLSKPEVTVPIPDYEKDPLQVVKVNKIFDWKQQMTKELSLKLSDKDDLAGGTWTKDELNRQTLIWTRNRHFERYPLKKQKRSRACTPFPISNLLISDLFISQK